MNPYQRVAQFRLGVSGPVPILCEMAIVASQHAGHHWNVTSIHRYPRIIHVFFVDRLKISKDNPVGPSYDLQRIQFHSWPLVAKALLLWLQSLSCRSCASETKVKRLLCSLIGPRLALPAVD